MIGPIAILFYDKSKSNSIELRNLFYGCRYIQGWCASFNF